MFLPNPVGGQEQVVLRHYVSHPDKIVQLLTRMGSEHVRDHGRYITGTCPLHRGDNPKGFSVYYDRDVPLFKCFTRCKKKGPIHLLPRLMWGQDSTQALQFLAGFAGISFDGQVVTRDWHDIEGDSVAQFCRRRGLAMPSMQMSRYSEAMVAQSRSMPRPPFFESRGLPAAVLDCFELGFVPANTWVWPVIDPMTGRQRVHPKSGRLEWAGWFEDRVSIPLRAANRVLAGFSGRQLVDTPTNKAKKYKILPGTTKEALLYGLHQPQTVHAIHQTRRVYLFEGFAAVWRAWQHGFFNSIACMGSMPGDEQIRQLNQLPIDALVCFFDGDKAGYEGAARLGELMSGGLIQVLLAFPPEGADPGDLKERAAFEAPLHRATRFVPQKELRP